MPSPCIFPLTQRHDLNRSIGTRHRAAIGLTEETDALVVVVSEETGAISYAYKGQIVRGITIEELRSFLTSILVHERDTGPVGMRWLRNLFSTRTVPDSGTAVITRSETPPASKTENR